MESLFYVAIALLAGMLLTKLLKPFNLPHVTGYLLAGVLIGPFVGGILHHEHVESLEHFNDVTLGFIAFAIGNAFHLSDMKKMGAKIFVIVIFETLTAITLVTGGLLALGVEKPIALCLGAIASSTAPAATLLIIRQYKAKGPVTNTLLPVIALDNTVCLIAFSIASSLSQGIIAGQEFSLANGLIAPITQVLSSIFVGLLLGSLLSVSSHFFKKEENRIVLALIAIILGVSLAEHYHLSRLLLCMVIGACYINMGDNAEKVMHYINGWTSPLFILFFVVAGAELNIWAIGSVGFIGVLYILLRAVGKWAGASIATRITGCEENIKKYLGFSLIPQGGVAIGMARLASQQIPVYGALIQTIILSATLVYEFVGPLATRKALQKAGEIKM